jgi:hypothetical protein
LARFGHYYTWFVIVVAGLAGLPRLLLSRRFAELQYSKLQEKGALKRTRFMGVMILVAVIGFIGLYFTRWGHEVWIKIAVVFSLLSAGEFFFQAQYPGMESLVFQNRLLGILYVGLAAAAYIMLART